MTFDELLAEAVRQGYQLVPLPEVIDHDLRPGDAVVDVLPEWAKNVALKAHVAKHFDLNDKPAVVLAVASRADVLLRYPDGRVAFRIAKGLLATPTVQKVQP